MYRSKPWIHCDTNPAALTCPYPDEFLILLEIGSVLFAMALRRFRRTVGQMA